MREYSTAQVGKFGENQCAKYIKKVKKLKILDRNVIIGKLEMDIIAFNDDYIVFIEVKARRTDKSNFWRPASAVNKEKQANLINFSNIYCKSLPKKHQNKTPRIDVCEVYVSADKKLTVQDLHYIQNAVTR